MSDITLDEQWNAFFQALWEGQQGDKFAGDLMGSVRVHVAEQQALSHIIIWHDPHFAFLDWFERTPIEELYSIQRAGECTHRSEEIFTYETSPATQ